MVSDREDRKQTAKPIDVSHSQGSTTENIRKIANREDRKETVTRPTISQARFHSRRQDKYIPQRT